MPRYRALPPAEELSELARDHTHAQIAEIVSERGGVRVSRSAISSALSRAGLSGHKARYEATVPWSVAGKDDDNYHVRMLRALGRVQAGGELDARSQARLDAWVRERHESRTAVAYDRERGFHLVPADGDSLISE